MKFFGLLLLVAPLSSGCATLFSSGPDRVQVESNPPGARVAVDNVDVGVTPTAVSLDRRIQIGNIKVEAPGYEPAITQRPKRFNAISVLNCLNPVFWGIDLITGNYQEFDKTPVSVNLVPLAYAPVPGRPPYPPQPGYPQPGAPQPARYPQQPAPGYPPSPPQPGYPPPQGYPPPGYPPPPAPPPRAR